MKKINLLFIAASFIVQAGVAQNTFPATGNAGISTTTPSFPLEIVCNNYSGTDPLSVTYPNNGIFVSMNGNSGATVYLQHNNANGRRWGLTSAGPQNFAAGDFYITNFTNAIDAMVFKPSGSIGIGVYTPTERFHTIGGVRFEGITTGGTPNNLVSIDANGKLWRYALPGGTNQLTNSCTSGNINYIPKYNSTNGVTCSQIYDNGTNVGIGTTSPSDKLTVNGNIRSLTNTFLSDQRFKKQIRPETEMLSRVMKLKIYSYQFKETEGFEFDKANHFGLLAQELKEVFPDLVKEGNDKVLSVNYIELIPIMIQSIKEQNIELENLKKEMAEIRALLKGEKAISLVNGPSKFSIFPNPANTNITLHKNDNNVHDNTQVIITDMNGRTIKLKNISKTVNTTNIDISALSSGTYSCSVYSNSGMIWSEKFTKQ